MQSPADPHFFLERNWTGGEENLNRGFRVGGIAALDRIQVMTASRHAGVADITWFSLTTFPTCACNVRSRLVLQR